MEAKEGTLLAPSNEALERADKARLDHVLGSDYLRAEMLGLHFVRDKIISSDYKIRVGGDQVGSIYDIASSSSSNGKPSWLRGDVHMTSAPTGGRGSVNF